MQRATSCVYFSKGTSQNTPELGGRLKAQAHDALRGPAWGVQTNIVARSWCDFEPHLFPLLGRLRLS